MSFAVNFAEETNSKNLRIHNLSAHINWLKNHRDSVWIAGSLRHNPSGKSIAYHSAPDPCQQEHEGG